MSQAQATLGVTAAGALCCTLIEVYVSVHPQFESAMCSCLPQLAEKDGDVQLCAPVLCVKQSRCNVRTASTKSGLIGHGCRGRTGGTQRYQWLSQRKVAHVLAIAVAAVLLLCPQHANGDACPNDCSYRGTCDTETKCTCHDGFTGADCSQRSCPTGTAAWVDKAVADDDAHNALLECSNAGLCNRDTGVCQCFEPYTGDACQRTVCPYNCFNHGVCKPMSRLATEEGIDDSVPGDGVGQTYANWDAEKLWGCVCDLGWTGPDCSLEMCAKGGDGNDLSPMEHVVVLQTDNSDDDEDLTGSFIIVFNGQRSAALDADGVQVSAATNCETAFLSLPGIATVKCFVTATEAGNLGATYTVRFTLAPFGQNNLHALDGSITSTEELVDTYFQCDTSLIVIANTPSCTFTMWSGSFAAQRTGSDITTTYRIMITDEDSDPNQFDWSVAGGAWTQDVAMTGTWQTLSDQTQVNFGATDVGWTQYAEWTVSASGSDTTITASPLTMSHDYCGGGGVCNFNNGNCTCGEGLVGVACEKPRYLNVSTEATPAWAALHLNESKSDYAGNVLQMRLDDNLARDDTWTAIRGIANEVTQFRVEGSGSLTAPTVTFTGAWQADTFTADNGRTITTGGLDIDAGGMSIDNGLLKVIGVGAGGATIDQTSATEATLVVRNTNGAFGSNTPVLQIDIDPARAGGEADMLDTEANSASLFNVRSDGAITIPAGMVSGDASTVTGVVRTQNGDASVTTGGIDINSAAQSVDLVSLSNTDGSFDAEGIAGQVTSDISTSLNMLHLRAGGSELFRIRGDGHTHIVAGGLDIDDTGLSIDAGGLAIGTDGCTVSTGGLDIAAGGATVQAGGLQIGGGGMEVSNVNVVDTTMNILATNSAFGSNAAALLVGSNGAGETTDANNMLLVRRAGVDLFQIHGSAIADADDTVIYADTVIGSADTDSLSLEAVAIEGNLVFSGANVGDGFDLTLSIPDLTVGGGSTHTILARDLAASRVLTKPTGASDAFTAWRIPYTDSNGQLVDSSQMTFTSATALALNGPTSATVQSSTGAVSLLGDDITATANGGIATLQSTTDEVRIVTADTGNGDMYIDADGGSSRFHTEGASSAITWSTADAGAGTSGLIALYTGDASGGATGSVTISTGSGEPGGDIVLSVGSSTGSDGSDVSITAGQSTGTGGDVTVTAGAASRFITGKDAGTTTLQGGDGHASNIGSEGGNVVLQPGADGACNPIPCNHGSVFIRSGDATSRLEIDNEGQVVWSSVEASITTAAGDFTSTANAAQSITTATNFAMVSTGGSTTVTSETDFIAKTDDTSGVESADITIRAGDTDTGDGGSVSLFGGDSADADSSEYGGNIVFTAGAGTAGDSTGSGGDVSIAAGGRFITGYAISQTGGDVTITAGADGGGSDHGSVLLQIDGTTIVEVAADGSVDIPAAGSVPSFSSSSSGAVSVTATGGSGTIDISAAGAMTLSSANGAFTAESEDDLTLTTDVIAGASGAISFGVGATDVDDPVNDATPGGAITFEAGENTGNFAAGSVTIDAGDAATGGTSSGGSIAVQPGTGATGGATRVLQADGSVIVNVDGDGGLTVTATSVDMHTKADAATGVDISTGDNSAGSTGGITLSAGVATATGTAGSATLLVGKSTTAAGAAFSATAGKTTQQGVAGGAVVVTGGASTHATSTTGGAVSLVGGAGTNVAVGGSVVLKPGSGTTDGVFRVQDVDGNTRIQLAADKSLTFDADTGSATATLQSAGALGLASSGSTATLASSGAMTMSSSTGVVTVDSYGAITMSTSERSGSQAGGIAITPGTATNYAGVGGAVILSAGETTGATLYTGGQVSITGGKNLMPAQGGSGGSVVVTGGAGGGSADGGVVYAQAADATGDVSDDDSGFVTMNDSGGNKRIYIDQSGFLQINGGAGSTLGATGGELTFESTGNGDTTIVRGSSSVTIEATSSTGIVSSTSTMTIKTTDATTPAGVAILAGEATGDNHGAAVSVVGSATSGVGHNGGDVNANGGDAGAGSNGIGGSIVLKSSTGANSNGAVQLQDADADVIAEVDSSGTLNIVGDDATAVSIYNKADSGATTQIHTGDHSSSGSGALSVYTGAATGVGPAAGAVSVQPGETNTGNGGAVSVTAGLTSASSATAGGITVSGGESTDSTATVGGFVSVVGGPATTVGGEVRVKAGDGSTTDGQIKLQNAPATRGITVSSTGSLSLDATDVSPAVVPTITIKSDGAATLSSTASTLTASSKGASTFTSTGAGATADMTLLGEDGVSLLIEDAADSGGILVTPGEASGTGGGSRSGGSVSVLAGESGVASGQGGIVSIVGGSGEVAGGTGGSVKLSGGVPGTAGNDGSVILQRGSDGVLTVDDDGDITFAMASVSASTDGGTTSGDLTAGSGSGTAGDSGAVTLRSGTASSNAAPGTVTIATGRGAGVGDLLVAGGATTKVDGASTVGGAVAITGGLADDGTSSGGSVILVGGTNSIGTGGSVVLAGGGGTNKGSVYLYDEAEAGVVSVDKDGQVTISGPVMALDASASNTIGADNGATTVSAPSTVTVSSTGGSVVISGTLGTAIVTDDPALNVQASAVTVQPGSTTTNTPGLLTVQGGSASGSARTGGDVAITGGTEGHGTDGLGGTTSIVGGAATDTSATDNLGGDVIIRAGAGGTGNGGVFISSPDATPNGRLYVNDDGSLTVFTSAATALQVDSTAALTYTGDADVTFAAAGAMTVESTGAALSLGASGTTSVRTTDTANPSAITAKPGDSSGAAAVVTIAGGEVSAAISKAGDAILTGGSHTAGTGTGGDVVITAGDGRAGTPGGPTYTGGNVIIQSGDGTSENGAVELRHRDAEDGGMKLNEDATLEVKDDFLVTEDAKLGGPVVLPVNTVPASTHTVVDVQHPDAVVVTLVTDDGNDNLENKLVVQDTPTDGQVIIIINEDAQDLSGAFTLPAGKTLRAVYSTVDNAWHEYIQN